jgi:hypothetical protein
MDETHPHRDADDQIIVKSDDTKILNLRSAYKYLILKDKNPTLTQAVTALITAQASLE